MKYYGHKGFANRVENYYDLAKFAEQSIIKRDSLEMMSQRTSFNVCFRFKTGKNIDAEIIELFEKGLLLKNETKPTLPAKLVVQSNNKALLSIQEGRYHQVKRMFAAVGNHVEALHRVSIGTITLDAQLGDGEWRYLTEDEITSMKSK